MRLQIWGRTHYSRPLRLIAGGVLLSGLLAIAGVLFGQIKQSSGVPIVSADANATLLAGFSLVYLASLLRRGKKTAWWVAIALYIFLLMRNAQHFINDYPSASGTLPVLLNLLIPALSLIGLIIYRRQFNVRSEVRSLTSGLRTAGLILVVAIIFGTAGFQLMDEHDFHREVSIPTSLHYTVDQFNLTTAHPLVPYSRRARLFLDSLGATGLIAIIYASLSVFSPIRFRLSGQSNERELLAKLLKEYPVDSEDYFKLWPHDKAYFFSASRQAGLAYHVANGVALVVGDPAGRPSDYDNLLVEFEEYCRINDWQVAFIHTHPNFSKFYKRLGFELQKIGEEAVVNIGNFVHNTQSDKYFRQISNRYEKLGYQCKILSPPHEQGLLARLKEISNDWLNNPGRAERGMMMGYFSYSYLQQCDILVARDSSKVIHGFINQVPSFSPSEANFDMLRHSSDSPGNINDYMLMNFIEYAGSRGFTTLNMGLSPLAGLDRAERSAISSLLLFVYERGNRFYSFKGLARFKDKYQPNWQSRYIVYRGGAVGFTRTMNALLKAMRVKKIS